MSSPRWLGRTVITLAIVSLLTDLSSEMIYPLLPIFLTATLGASAAAVGMIEGAAETVAAFLKLVSGWWSDRVRRRKPLVVAGYALASLARPLVAIAGSAGQVLAVRLADRVGKGIRSAPRDALLAAAVPPAERGRAFGFHRAADHLGAVLGPLVAFALLRWGGVALRTVFWLAAVPAALAVLVLVLGVREERATPERLTNGSSGDAAVPPRVERPAAEPARGPAPATPPGRPGALRPFLVALALFTLGNSSDAFLVLRATALGVPVPLVPILWALLHAVKSATATPGGALSDRVGRKPTIVAGWLLYAGVYLGFARATAAWQAWALFALYGVVFGLTEGAEKALVADLAPAARRGAAFGWYNLTLGVGALPASALFGVLWDRAGASVAFVVGAGLSLVAAAALAFGVRAPADIGGR